MTPSHLRGAAQSDDRDYRNRKPYRSKALKQKARERARKDADGAYRTAADVLFHD